MHGLRLTERLVQDPVRSAIIDSCIRVTDNGRESIQRKVCNTLNVFCFEISYFILLLEKLSYNVFFFVQIAGLFHLYPL